AFGLEFGTNIQMVVDLAVEGDGKPAAFATHRLRAGLREIENGKPAVAEGNATRGIGPDTAGIRPPMCKRLGHAPGRARKQAIVRTAAGPEETCYAAHVVTECPFSMAVIAVPPRLGATYSDSLPRAVVRVQLSFRDRGLSVVGAT